jgi:hypothetical protein
VRWVRPVPLWVAVCGWGVVHVGVWEGRDSLAVATVNLTNPMAMKGPIREILPIGPIQVTARLPAGAEGLTAQLLVAAVDVPVRVDGDRASVTLPDLELLEVVHLSWKSLRKEAFS